MFKYKQKRYNIVSSYKMNILVFDTETTGLPKTRTIDVNNESNLALWPHIVQFSYVIYNTQINDITKIQDHIIKINSSTIIPDEVIKIHNITNEICELKGKPLINILKQFFDDLNTVDYLVGHNIEFDLNVLKAELGRLSLHYYIEQLNTFMPKNKIYCTMRETINFCNIEKPKMTGGTYKKFPKLQELYIKLFNEIPKHLHNSLIDVFVCLRCFLKFKFDIDFNLDYDFISMYSSVNLLHI
jgi:DNA polymerase III subunit alpha